MGIPALDERLLRGLAALAGAAAFLTAAAVVRPDWSRAEPPAPTPRTASGSEASPASPASPTSPTSPTSEASGGSPNPADADADADAATDRPPVADLLPGVSLGRLEGRDMRIEVRATPAGPRYHVVGPDGVISDPAGLTAAELAERHPELDLRETLAEPGPLMLADPAAAFPD